MQGNEIWWRPLRGLLKVVAAQIPAEKHMKIIFDHQFLNPIRISTLYNKTGG